MPQAAIPACIKECHSEFVNGRVESMDSSTSDLEAIFILLTTETPFNSCISTESKRIKPMCVQNLH
jgi:hypothetical protein